MPRPKPSPSARGCVSRITVVSIVAVDPSTFTPPSRLLAMTEVCTVATLACFELGLTSIPSPRPIEPWEASGCVSSMTVDAIHGNDFATLRTVVYIGALFLTAIAVWQITGDGEAQLFEGLALIAIYVVLAAFALYD